MEGGEETLLIDVQSIAHLAVAGIDSRQYLALERYARRGQGQAEGASVDWRVSDEVAGLHPADQRGEVGALDLQRAADIALAAR